MTISQLYQRISKLEQWTILAYAVAVFLPITICWIVLITGLVLWVARAAIETILIRKNWKNLDEPEAVLSSGNEAAMPPLAGETRDITGNTERVSVRQAFFSAPSVRSLKLAPLALPLVVFAYVVMLVGALVGGPKEAFSSLFTLRALLIYFLAFHVFMAAPRIRVKALKVLLCVGAAAGLWGAIQQIFHFHPFEKFQYLQATGFLRNPMAYAGQMQIMACLAIALYLTGGMKSIFKNPAVFTAIASCNVLGAFFASERSAWLGLFAGTMVMARLLSWRVFLGMVLALAVAGLISWFAVPVVQTRLMPVFADPISDVGVSARLVVWEKSIEIWRDNPLIGVGVRNFPMLDIPEAIVPGESTHLVHAHSNILHILATMGALGVLAFVYLQLSMLMNAYRTWKTPDPLWPEPDKSSALLQRGIALGALGGIVSLMVAGLFEYNFGTGHVRLMHWFVLAMVVSNVKLGPAEALEAPGGDKTHDNA